MFGSSGSGKTTLGKLVAKKLNFPYLDIDDYIWRNAEVIVHKYLKQDSQG
ncbi:shikimate kinase [Clostridium sp. AWRP]|nr:shikimate kinase [Clostridium sp. AWRP]